jgi:hypothetical protein
VTEHAFIVGRSEAAIAADVWRGHGWQRMSRSSWKDDDGRIVTYLHDPNQLEGTLGVLVYLVPGYDQHPAWDNISYKMYERKCESVWLDE